MATVPHYAELWCLVLEQFVFFRGASDPDELVLRARALGYTAVALTDECSMAGIVRTHGAALMWPPAHNAELRANGPKQG